MVSDNPSGARPPPVVLRIKLRYDDIDTMVQRFAPNVGKSGLFLPTKAPQPIGTEVKFELRLNNDQVVLVGLGRVKTVTPADVNNPRRAFGNSIELMRVSPQGRDLIMKMLARRRALGLRELAIPVAEDVDLARREASVEAGRFDVATPTPVTATLSGPVSAPIVVPASIPAVPPAAPPEPEPAPPTRPSRPSSPLPSVLTAPRRQTGPLSVAKVLAVPALAPEPPRRKRIAVKELIESASGPLASVTVPGLDDDIDVAAVLARARVLAGDLDAELAALVEENGNGNGSAIPLAISIEAASAELARQLGGHAVRRERSAGWAPPPAITESSAATEAATEDVAEAAAAIATAFIEDKPPASEPVAPEAAATVPSLPEPIEAIAPVEQVAADHDGDRVMRVRDDDDSGVRLDERPSVIRQVFPIDQDDDEQPPEPMIHDDADPDELEAALAPEHEVDAEQIADEIHQLDESDFEEVENTQVGAEAAYARPAHDDEAADRLDRELADAENEADDLGLSEFERGMATRAGAGDFSEEEHVSGFGEHRRYESAAAAPTDFGAGDFGADDEGVIEAGPNEFELPSEEDEPEADAEEIDDFEILAEADAEDEDLLASHGEQDISGAVSEAMQADVMRPSTSDFAARLDLGDDSADLYLPPNMYRGRNDEFAHEPGEVDPRIASAGHALAAFDEPEHDPLAGLDMPTPRPRRAMSPMYDGESSSFTIAGDASPADLDFDAPHAAFPPLHEFDQSDVIDPAKLPRQNTDDLENALEALDVDLDDLSIPHARTELPGSTIPPPTRSTRQQPPQPKKPARASTDDGVLIDFDDDD
jgi:hypothetical protein